MMDDDEIPIGSEFGSHGSMLAVPALLERLFFAADQIREGIRMYMTGEPDINTFINAREVLYIEVFGIVRPMMKKDEREVINDAFKNIRQIIEEIMKPPDVREVRMSTLELYRIVSDRMTDLWFLLNDFLQGKKQLYLREPASKSDLFQKELERMRKMIK